MTVVSVSNRTHPAQRLPYSHRALLRGAGSVYVKSLSSHTHMHTQVDTHITDRKQNAICLHSKRDNSLIRPNTDKSPRGRQGDKKKKKKNTPRNDDVVPALRDHRADRCLSQLRAAERNFHTGNGEGQKRATYLLSFVP